MEIMGYLIPKEYLILGFAAILLLFFIFSLSGWIIALNLKRKYKKILRDGAGKDITDAIVNYYQKCSSLMDDFKTYEEKIDFLEKNMKSCAQKIGSIRYNAFGGNNANQSYVVAVLDEYNNGFVLNGVNSRQQTVTYLKPIVGGHSQYELSNEEIEAVNTAQLNYEKNLEK